MININIPLKAIMRIITFGMICKNSTMTLKLYELFKQKYGEIQDIPKLNR